MDSLLWLTTGAAVVYALLGSLALVLRLGRPQESEHGFGMAVSFAMCAFALLRAFAIHWPDASESISRLMAICAIGALVAACHFVVIYTRPKKTRTWLLAIYGVGALYSFIAAIGNLRVISLQGSVAPGGLGVFGRPETMSGWSLYVVAAAAMALATLTSARRRISGAREVTGIVFGTGMWLATIVHDAAIAADTIGGPWLMQIGVLSFVSGTGASFISRYLHIANELEKSTAELERRTTQLRQSYHDLREAQEELVKKEQLAVVGELAAVVAHPAAQPQAMGQAVDERSKADSLNATADAPAPCLTHFHGQARRRCRSVCQSHVEATAFERRSQRRCRARCSGVHESGSRWTKRCRAM